MTEHVFIDQDLLHNSTEESRTDDIRNYATDTMANAYLRGNAMFPQNEAAQAIGSFIAIEALHACGNDENKWIQFFTNQLNPQQIARAEHMMSNLHHTRGRNIQVAAAGYEKQGDYVINPFRLKALYHEFAHKYIAAKFSFAFGLFIPKEEQGIMLDVSELEKHVDPEDAYRFNVLRTIFLFTDPKLRKYANGITQLFEIGFSELTSNETRKLSLQYRDTFKGVYNYQNERLRIVGVIRDRVNNKMQEKLTETNKENNIHFSPEAVKEFATAVI